MHHITSNYGRAQSMSREGCAAFGSSARKLCKLLLSLGTLIVVVNNPFLMAQEWPCAPASGDAGETLASAIDFVMQKATEGRGAFEGQFGPVSGSGANSFLSKIAVEARPCTLMEGRIVFINMGEGRMHEYIRQTLANMAPGRFAIISPDQAIFRDTLKKTAGNSAVGDWTCAESSFLQDCVKNQRTVNARGGIIELPGRPFSLSLRDVLTGQRQITAPSSRTFAYGPVQPCARACQTYALPLEGVQNAMRLAGQEVGGFPATLGPDDLMPINLSQINLSASGGAGTWRTHVIDSAGDIKFSPGMGRMLVAGGAGALGGGVIGAGTYYGMRSAGCSENSSYWTSSATGYVGGGIIVAYITSTGVAVVLLNPVGLTVAAGCAIAFSPQLAPAREAAASAIGAAAQKVAQPTIQSLENATKPESWLRAFHIPTMSEVMEMMGFAPL
jgi:hypothetical protein